MTIDFELSEKSIDNAIHRIELYNKDLLKKTEVFVDRLAEVVKDNAEKELIENVAIGERMDETLDSLDIRKSGQYTRQVVVSGAAVWLEFGTGVVANNCAPGEYLHPKAAELGMSGIGEYGKRYGSRSYGWWYKDQYGERQHTYGIPATRFMWHSAAEGRYRLVKIGRETFHT